MNDRFRFRVFYKPHNKIYNVICLNSDRQKEIIIEYKGSTALVEWENCDILQCTGLKDKNGKLIYEGDIVKYAEFDWTDFSFKDWETEIAQVVWGNTYDNYYPAFDLKDTDFDGTNSFAYLFNEGWTIEVIGNIYESPELLEE